MFHVGQKVVCINDRVGAFRLPSVIFKRDLHGLKRGEVYTVRSMYVSPHDGIACVRLQEITRPFSQAENGEVGYAAVRFRPVVERKTDISLFLAMLNTEKVDA